MLTHWTRGLALAGLGMATVAGTGLAQQPAGGGAPPRADRAATLDRISEGDLPGPIDSLQDFQDTGRMVFKMADTNNDNQISQKEATDAGNLLVGGFFFRADANGDGTLSKDEAQQARDALLEQKPFLRVVLRRAQAAKNDQGAQAAGTNPAQGLSALLDGNNDRQIQAGELRQAVQTGVQALYAAADTNRDGQMSPGEINAAIVGGAQAAAQTAFQAADQDRNGALSQQEFDKALVEPANFIFSMVDVNGDDQITTQEAQAAQRLVMNRLKMLEVPEPANSARNLIERGRYQGDPIPNLGSPNAPNRTQPAPARPAAPAPAPAPVPR